MRRERRAPWTISTGSRPHAARLARTLATPALFAALAVAAACGGSRAPAPAVVVPTVAPVATPKPAVTPTPPPAAAAVPSAAPQPADLRTAANAFGTSLIHNDIAGLIRVLTPEALQKAMAIQQQQTGGQPAPALDRFDMSVDASGPNQGTVSYTLVSATGSAVMVTQWQVTGGVWKVNDLKLQ